MVNRLYYRSTIFLRGRRTKGLDDEDGSQSGGSDDGGVHDAGGRRGTGTRRGAGGADSAGAAGVPDDGAGVPAGGQLDAEGGLCGCGPSSGHVWVAPIDGAPAGRSGGRRRPDGWRGGGGAADGQGAGKDPVAAARPRAVPVGTGAWEVSAACARPADSDCADGRAAGARRMRFARFRC
jgi:hypothetical protein